MLAFLRTRSVEACWSTTVCTGSALLAKAGLLDDRRATSNKLAFDWATSQSPRVQWRRAARCVLDSPFMTSSGVSARTEMASRSVERLYDRGTAERTAKTAACVRHDDPSSDPFALP
ncbi:DJ-1/PfpI family protein [Sphingomonas dokdonensis]|uniref:DJ-1/PfpI family protein n=1 Tax=Sphingomonas dokdonensis TaxID=344880 RepID=UPI000B4BBD29